MAEISVRNKLYGHKYSVSIAIPAEEVKKMVLPLRCASPIIKRSQELLASSTAIKTRELYPDYGGLGGRFNTLYPT